MAYPSDSDFNLYDGSLITNVQWDSNFQKIPILWSSGAYDINVGTITAANYIGVPTVGEFTGTTGESIDAGDVLRLSGGLLYKATASTSSGVTGVVGISTTTTASGLTATVATNYYSSFSGLVVGATYYVGVNGAKGPTEPSEYPVELGIAVSSTRLNLNIQEDKTPVGSIVAYTLGTKPNGTLLADGSLISRTTHSRLFDVIGTTYGIGDGATTFGTPNFEGEFLRGLGSGRTIGDTQADSTAANGLGGTTTDDGAHSHDLYAYTYGTNVIQNRYLSLDMATSLLNFLDTPQILKLPFDSDGPPIRTAGVHKHTLASMTGDPETRPANKSVLYAIKL